MTNRYLLGVPGGPNSYRVAKGLLASDYLARVGIAVADDVASGPTKAGELVNFLVRRGAGAEWWRQGGAGSASGDRTFESGDNLMEATRLLYDGGDRVALRISGDDTVATMLAADGVLDGLSLCFIPEAGGEQVIVELGPTAVEAATTVRRMDTVDRFEDVFDPFSSSSQTGAWVRDSGGSTGSGGTGPGDNTVGAYMYSEASGTQSYDTLRDNSRITVLDGLINEAAWDTLIDRVLRLRLSIAGQGWFDIGEGFEVRGRVATADEWERIALYPGWPFSNSGYIAGETLFDSEGTEHVIALNGGWVDFASVVPRAHTQLQLRSLPMEGTDAPFRHDVGMWSVEFGRPSDLSQYVVATLTAAQQSALQAIIADEQVRVLSGAGTRLRLLLSLATTCSATVPQTISCTATTSSPTETYMADANLKSSDVKDRKLRSTDYLVGYEDGLASLADAARTDTVAEFLSKLYPIPFADAIEPAAGTVGLIENINGVIYQHAAKHHEGHGKTVVWGVLADDNFRGFHHRSSDIDNPVNGNFYVSITFGDFEIRRNGRWVNFNPFEEGEVWGGDNVEVTLDDGSATTNVSGLVMISVVLSRQDAFDRATANGQVYANRNAHELIVVTGYAAPAANTDDYFRRIYSSPVEARPETAYFWLRGSDRRIDPDFPYAPGNVLSRMRFNADGPDQALNGWSYGNIFVAAANIDSEGAPAVGTTEVTFSLPEGLWDLDYYGLSSTSIGQLAQVRLMLSVAGSDNFQVGDAPGFTNETPAEAPSYGGAFTLKARDFETDGTEMFYIRKNNLNANTSFGGFLRVRRAS